MLGNTATSAEVKQEIQRVIDSPCTSFWLKEAFEVLLQRDCLDAARDAGVVTLMHCEDGAILDATLARLQAQGRTSLAYYAESRPELAEIVATQDWDALLYGSPVLIRNLMSHGKRRRGRLVSAEKVVLEELLADNEISREQLVDLAIMIGTDFHPGIKGIGPKTGLKLIKEHGDIETICKVKEKPIPENLEQIRSIFLDHPCNDVKSMKQGLADENGLRQFLLEDFDFSEQRLERNLKRLKGRVRKGGQPTLFEF